MVSPVFYKKSNRLSLHKSMKEYINRENIGRNKLGIGGRQKFGFE
jgi:hypothetical protein